MNKGAVLRFLGGDGSGCFKIGRIEGLILFGVYFLYILSILHGI